MYITNKKTLQN